MAKILSFLLLCFSSYFMFSQEYLDGTYTWTGQLSEDLGVDTQPLLTDSVLAMRSQGDLMDFTGGYQIGDTVADFTAYGLNSSQVEFRELIETSSLSGKYTILFSGSNSCNKATGFFNVSSYTSEAQTFVSDHINDFNWMMIYGYEAHPIDSENCLTNCPPFAVAGPAGIGEFQHQTYEDRLESMSRWVGIQNGTIEVPETTAIYTNGQTEPTGEQDQVYVPLGVDIPVYADNPDNLIYDTFFKKPFGVLVIDCSGIVVHQGDWFSEWMISEDPQNGINYLASLLDDDEELSCHEWFDFCQDNSLDDDNDGLCNEWEIQNGTDPNNICSPFGDDSDFDNLCDLEEESMGLDPFNPDSDNDFLSDGEELILGTDPLDPDTDGDGMLDGNELKAQRDPLTAEDSDFDISLNDDTIDNLNFDLETDPTQGKVTVRLQETDEYTITISTPEGKVIFEDVFGSKAYSINTNEFQLGVFIVRVTDASGRIKSQRLLLE